MGASIKIGKSSLYLPNPRVRVYRNLTKKCWSVLNRYTGKVILRADALTLVVCKFQVSEPGRKRVLREKRKNVHAFVQGVLVSVTVGDMTVSVDDLWQFDSKSPERLVTYNPYRAGYFYQTANGKKVQSANMVTFREDGTVKALKPSIEERWQG